ncbi:hypothetical protein [Colwellia psychrerythraea]|uniref:Uncharacterized protein n=1 Tax=Colwellia psychrerythraea TaxID=28229 RepID=A0A099KYE0_COLPS|nr:hypothetical protein [Colwellia psychrerythraea]KGJ94643.1 hypothetical protein ND2E_1832 [Colwellia psychrerythraea]
MELTFFLTWVACLLSYSASINQKLFNKPLNKPLAWGGFIIFLTGAYIAASQWHIVVIACFYVLALVMTFWIIIIFMHGHIKNKNFPTAITAVMLLSVLVSLGGQYAT